LGKFSGDEAGFFYRKKKILKLIQKNGFKFSKTITNQKILSFIGKVLCIGNTATKNGKYKGTKKIDFSH